MVPVDLFQANNTLYMLMLKLMQIWLRQGLMRSFYMTTSIDYFMLRLIGIITKAHVGRTYCVNLQN